MSKVTAKKLVNVKDLSRKEWLVWRQKGMGGSDAAAAVGLNKFQDAMKLYMSKVDPIEDVGEISESAEWGNRHEPTIRNKFIEMHPELKIKRSFIMWQHPKYDYLLANVDGLIFHPEKGWGILEIKTAHEYLKDQWDDEEVPESYLIQIQHYLGVMGLNYGYFAVLMGGNKYKEFYVERDDAFIDALFEIEKNFWNEHVLKRVIPSPDGSDSSGDVLQLLFPANEIKDEDEVKELSDGVLGMIQEYDEILKQEKELEQKKKKIQQDLQMMLGDHQIGKVEGEKRKIRWKPSNSFKEDLLKKDRPDLFEKYSMQVLDKAEFKKAHPKVYKEYMIPSTKRTFSIK